MTTASGPLKYAKNFPVLDLPRNASSVESRYLCERALTSARQKTHSVGVQPSTESMRAIQQKKSLQERLFDVKAESKILTRQLTMHFPPDWHLSFFKQLDNLLDAEEWNEQDEPVTRDSFFTFIRLLLKFKNKRRPGIGIADYGHIVAAWTAGPTDRLTVECLPKDRVRWVVSVPIDGGFDSAAGDTSLDRLMASLQPYTPEHWLADEIRSTSR